MNTSNYMIKEVRRAARNNDMTFKQSNVKINGARLWKLVDRKTGELLISNYQLNSAYEDSQSGYIDSYDRKKGLFVGIA